MVLRPCHGGCRAPLSLLLTALALLQRPAAGKYEAYAYDMLIGMADGTVRYYLNTGSKSRFTVTPKTYVETYFALAQQTTAATNPLHGEDVGLSAQPTCADLDGDLDLDCFVGESTGTVKYYKNIDLPNRPMFTEQTTAGSHPLYGVDFGTNAAPFCERDFDGDGDYDCLVGLGDGTVVYYKNTGSTVAPTFAAQAGAANPLAAVAATSDATLFCADMDNDGDFDCFVGNAAGALEYWRNTGSASAPAFTKQAGAANPFNGVSCGTKCVPRCIDADFDGDIDCFVGTGAGTILYYQNVGTPAAPTFTAITGTANPFNGWALGGAISPMFLDLDAECAIHNECNGHGQCFPPQQCKCFDGYGSASDISFYKAPDCSKRVCPPGPAWADAATTATAAHALAECSDKGLCDRSTGKCACFDGFAGDSCERLSCPTAMAGYECSGHGVCVSIRQQAAMTNALPLSPITTYTYGEATWDFDSAYGCVCDSSWLVGLAAGQRQTPEWFGVDCSLQRCPTGDNPDTPKNELDCAQIVAPGGKGTGADGNLCHLDCSGKGVCDYGTGGCTCYPGYYGYNCGTADALAVNK